MFTIRRKWGEGAKDLIRAPKETKQLISEGKNILGSWGVNNNNKPVNNVDVQKIMANGTKKLDLLPSILKAGLNKKANITNVLMISVILFVVTVSIFLGDRLFYEGIVDNSVLNSTNTSLAIINSVSVVYDNSMDTFFIICFLGLWLISFIGAMIVRSNPILLFVSVLAFALMLILSGFLANMIDAFTASAGGDFAERYPTMTYVNSHMMLFSLLYGASILLGMFFAGRME